MHQILIMSSDPVLRKKNIDVLIESDLRVFESPDALDGLLKVDKNGFDLIIIDEELSDADGYEACKKIRQYSDIPVILLGFESEEQVWARIEELGFDLYIKKPVSPRELMARVKAVLRRTPSKPKPVDETKAFADVAPIQDKETIKEKTVPSDSRQACPNCGAENPTGQNFCGTCASNLIPEIEPAQVATPQKTAPITKEEPADMPQQKACPNCGAKNPTGQKFCGTCASNLIPEIEPAQVATPQEITPTQPEEHSEIQPQKIICPNCGTQNLSVQKFCGECAASLVQAAQGTPVTPLQETRQVKLDKAAAERSTQTQLKVNEPTASEETTLQVWQDVHVAKLIDALTSGKLTKIIPALDFTTEGGFGYPEVDGLLDTSGNETKQIIEQLANNNVLDKKSFERFIVDPDGSFQLVPVERCTQCDTGDISKGQLIEHFACGNISLDIDYRSDNQYICPKCKKELQLLGTDYQYAGTQYRCRNNHTFPKPALKWRNIETGKIWDPEQLGESRVYSYSLKPDKKDWLRFQLKPKAQLVSFLKNQGYQVEELAKLQGKSGAVHTIDILATRNDVIANFKVGIGILTPSSGKGQVSLEQLFKFDTISYDTGINYKVVIAMPKLSTEAAKFAEGQKIGVFETVEPSALISFLNSQTNLSPSALPGRYLDETDVMPGPKGQLVGLLHHHGYQVSEKAKISGRSGAEHVFDIFAQRDDAIVRPTIAVAISNTDGEQMVGIDKVSQFDAAAYDAGIPNKVFVGIPQVSSEGKKLAKQQRIKVIDEHELGRLLQT